MAVGGRIQRTQPIEHRSQISHARLVEQLHALGVEPGDVLLVHTSFRAVRPVEGGPTGLIRALLEAVGPDGTLVMPCWASEDDVPFDPVHMAPPADLGVVAGTFWRMPGVLRSDYVHAFAAHGPAAAHVVGGALPLPPHIPDSPVGRVHALGGRVLLLGVDHDADTTLHLAEVLAGVPYGIAKYCTVLEDGAPVRKDYVENDHCCALFRKADGWLRDRGLQSEGPIGHAHARLIPSRDIVAVALEHLRADPFVFLHAAGAGCEECDLAREHVNR